MLIGDLQYTATDISMLLIIHPQGIHLLCQGQGSVIMKNSDFDFYWIIICLSAKILNLVSTNPNMHLKWLTFVNVSDIKKKCTNQLDGDHPIKKAKKYIFSQWMQHSKSTDLY